MVYVPSLPAFSGRFKRKVQSEDIIKEVKRHSYYLKPGEKRRVKSALVRKRARKRTAERVPLRPTRAGTTSSSTS